MSTRMTMHDKTCECPCPPRGNGLGNNCGKPVPLEAWQEQGAFELQYCPECLAHHRALVAKVEARERQDAIRVAAVAARTDPLEREADEYLAELIRIEAEQV